MDTTALVARVCRRGEGSRSPTWGGWG